MARRKLNMRTTNIPSKRQKASKQPVGPTALRDPDVRHWLNKFPLAEVYRFYAKCRTTLYFWGMVPTSKKHLRLIANTIPLLTEVIDFDVLLRRVVQLGSFTKGKFANTAKEIFPELVTVSQMAYEVIIAYPGSKIEKADAFLEAEGQKPLDDINLEAAIYLASRGKTSIVDVESIRRDWYCSVCDEVVRGVMLKGSIPAGVILQAKNRTIRLPDAAQALTWSNGRMQGFWSGRDEEMPFLPATVARAAEWLGLSEFNSWLESAARTLAHEAAEGFDPHSMQIELLFHAARSDLLFSLVHQKGLESWLWTLCNSTMEYGRPWRLFWGRTESPRNRDNIMYAATILFWWARFQPKGFDENLFKSALTLLIECVREDGSWSMWADDDEGCIPTTCFAIHAIALLRPTGWERLTRRAAVWLESVQHKFGCWEINGLPTVWLTVLALDAIELASDGLNVTFKTSMKKVKSQRTVERTAITEEDPHYEVKGQKWHNPTAPTIKEKSSTEVLNGQSIQIVILTATPVELAQVLRLLRPLSRQRSIIKVYESGETYFIGRFGAFRTAVLCCTIGAEGAGGSTLATNAAILTWNPTAIIMVGIAFGADRRKQRPADVLVAEQIVPYESQRISRGKPMFRDAIPPSGSLLRNRFRNAIGWRFTRPDKTQVAVHTGRILSGDKLVDDPKFKQWLLKSFPTVIGGEMEGAGVHAAATRNRTEWILVKGVCDWADGHKHDGYQEMAAAAAVSLCQFVLQDKTAMNELMHSNRAPNDLE